MTFRRLSLIVGVSIFAFHAMAASSAKAQTEGRAPALVRADVVALDQLIVYNRFGSFNPFGMMFALARDVARRTDAAPAAQCEGLLGVEGEHWGFAGSDANPISAIAGNARLRDCKRPRPLVIRGNVGDVLEIRFTNLLISQNARGSRFDPAQPVSNETDKPGFTESFCQGSSKGRHYGSDAKSPNFEDDLWRDLTAAPPGGKSVCAAGAEAPGDLGQTPRLAAGLPLDAARSGAASSQGAKTIDADWPSTRHVSLVANGLANVAGPDGTVAPACRGLDAVEPGKTVICRWRLDAEGSHFLSSLAAPAGGEGDGGSITHGLFAAIVVERAGSRAYRSQVTSAAFNRVWTPTAVAPHAREGVRPPAKGYEALDDKTGRPILAMHAARGEHVSVEGATLPVQELVHGDLNAIVSEWIADAASASGVKRESFREFTAILHDELKTFYASQFQELELFGAGQLAGVRDGFAINYGSSGMGTMLIANRKRIGPAADCAECLYEEFFLQSWANGDPALLEAFPDDPSNVHHSYLNDRVVFRNFHAGPKETHVFHLHAHQWLAGNDLNRGAYLDSQTVGPQQGFSYRIYHGGLNAYSQSPDKLNGSWLTLGAGNRNRTPGDSIFHCHLYPHFAQGMWALWRNHDVLEDGTRRLPDGQATSGLSLNVRPPGAPGAPLATRKGVDLATGASGEGTPIPAIVPLPDEDLATPLLPTYGDNGMPGFPFYIPGQPGRRAPQPPLDMAQDVENGVAVVRDGGLPRHIVESGTRKFAAAKEDENKSLPEADMLKEAGSTLARSLALADFSAEWKRVKLKTLPLDGTPIEKRAMAFHFDGRALWGQPEPAVRTADGAPAHYDSIKGGYVSGAQPLPFIVNGGAPRPGAPFADPCALPRAALDSKVWRAADGAPGERSLLELPDGFTQGNPLWSGLESFVADPGFIGFRRYRVSAVQTRLSVNRAGWHDPQARINVLSSEAFAVKTGEGLSVAKTPEPFFFRAVSGECIEFRHTNETPRDLARDDFQVATPTDTIGQHIHLVKFDVTSADGSGNGWNYEDGTFAPDEARERICAWQAGDSQAIGAGPLQAKLHGRTCEAPHAPLWARNAQLPQQRNWFQTTVQRWFADPLLSTTGRDVAGAHTPEMRDRTLRTVFTHDHFGPSSIQQHGFYAALVIEPQRHLVCADEIGATRSCSTPRGFDPAKRTGSFSGYDTSLIEDDAQMIGTRKIVMADRHEENLRWEEWQKEIARHENAGGAAVDIDKAKKAFEHTLNMREYALAIADFATLYDPAAAPGETQFAQGPRKGLVCIAQEAALKARKGQATSALELNKVCGGGPDVATEAELRKANDMPPAALAKLDAADADALRVAAIALRDREGRPIAPPRRPESISVDHHDPYVVNYRNAPIPLRVGADAQQARAGEETAYSGPCALFHPPGRKGPGRDVDTQIAGEVGDMANAFLTLAPAQSLYLDGEPAKDAKDPLLRRVLHSEPCTPTLESYTGERVQIRLIQGAQEVQHVFTVEGHSFPRNIDQRLPSAPLAPMLAAASAAASTRHARCIAADAGIAIASVANTVAGVDEPAKEALRAGCDNLDARMTAREVGISEHFEFASSFLSEGNSAQALTDRFLQLDVQGMTPKVPAQQDAAGAARRIAMQQAIEALSTGDTLYHFGSQDALWNGAWGFLRVHDGDRGGAKDHTLCLRRMADAPWSGPREYHMMDGCEGLPSAPPLQERLAKLDTLAKIVRRQPNDRAFNAPPSLLSSNDAQPTARSGDSDRAFVPRPANDAVASVSCPVDRAPARVQVTATADPHVYHGDPKANVDGSKLIDPYGLRLTGEIQETSGAPVTLTGGAGAGPLALRMNAGDCLELTIVNKLPADSRARRYGAPRMPDIVSLNVDRGDDDQKTGAYIVDAHGPNLASKRLRRSNRLALSVPLPTTLSRRDYGAPFGVNPTGALHSSDGAGDHPSSELITLYAGTMIANWDALDKTLAAPGQCYSPVGWSREPDKNRQQRVEVLGRSYYGAFADGGDRVKLAKCLQQKAFHDLAPRPYAFGALPIKSFGDVINHSSHGLAGMLVVEPEGATHLGAQGFASARFELPPIAGPGLAIPPALQSEHSLLWQDGLAMRARGRASADLWPVADCHICDDSYDFGKRAVNYRAEHLAARLGVKGGAAQKPGRRGVAVHGAFDWNKTSLPRHLFAPLPDDLFPPAKHPSAPNTQGLALAPLTSTPGDEVAIRIVHPGGRARQRAFVFSGGGYDDIAPGFGFPNATLLAPGKAVTAHLRDVARAGDCQIWRDGPNYMVGQGVWGLHRGGVAGACDDTPKPGLGK